MRFTDGTPKKMEPCLLYALQRAGREISFLTKIELGDWVFFHSEFGEWCLNQVVDTGKDTTGLGVVELSGASRAFFITKDFLASRNAILITQKDFIEIVNKEINRT